MVITFLDLYRPKICKAAYAVIVFLIIERISLNKNHQLI